jgi:hypothetical protein
MKKLLNYCRTQLSAFLSPEPEIQSDYVDKVVYLLRRDFNSKEQNEILVSIGTKIVSIKGERYATNGKRLYSLTTQY